MCKFWLFPSSVSAGDQRQKIRLKTTKTTDSSFFFFIFIVFSQRSALHPPNAALSDDITSCLSLLGCDWLIYQTVGASLEETERQLFVLRLSDFFFLSFFSFLFISVFVDVSVCSLISSFPVSAEKRKS